MFELRPYQVTAVERCMEDLKSVRSVGCILPTGSGKTEIFVEMCNRFTKENPTKAVLILSHLSLLTEQTFERFKLRAPSLNVAIMQRDNKPKWNTSVIISTMQTSRSQAHVDWMKDLLVRDIGLIVIDEAHFVPTESYQTILGYFPDAKLAGFTATPFRERKIMTTYFERISYSLSLQELIDNGHLVPPKLNEIITKGQTVSDVMASVIHLYKQECMDRSAIVYMQTVDDARLLRSAFEEAGIRSHAVTQELVGDYRSQILSAFNSGETKVLTTVNVLTAGFDSPRVGAIFMPYGTSSPTTYLQRIGRGLRPSEGKTNCLVYVFGDAPSVSKKVYEHMTNKILHAGGAVVSHATYKEDLLYNEYETTSDVYVWNKTVVEAIAKMEKLGMTEFARLLNAKAFPKRFMDNITKFYENLPQKKSSLPHGSKPATEAQQSALTKAGFESKALSQLTKAEASMMIGTLYNKSNRSSSSQPYVVPEGTHMGKHVSELPHAYRSLVKKRFPDSPVAKLIVQWEFERKRA